MDPGLPDPALLNAESGELLDALRAALRDEDRPLFDCLFVQGLSNSETQQRLRIAAACFPMRVSRLKRRLRGAIRRYTVSSSDLPSSIASAMTPAADSSGKTPFP
jgi:DNA-directed RNA polymerase specialized sigma subunit